MKVQEKVQEEKGVVGKGLLLWFLGVPVSVIVLLWLVGILR